MGWANFAILGVGGLLVAVPIVLHLMMQPKPQHLPFPALRFVRQRQHSNRARMRLRHFLLLLLRCLLIALFVLALAGPRVASAEFGDWLTVGAIGLSGLLIATILAAALLGGRRNPLLMGTLALLLAGHLAYGGWSAIRLLNDDSVQLIGDSGTPVAALVVVDTSPRMTYTRDNETRLDKAREMGTWLIGQFPADSQVCVLATDFDQPFFSVDVGAARKRLETLDISWLSNSLPDTLASGLSLLEESDLDRREVYVLTDMTAPSWGAGSESSVADRLRQFEGLSVFVVDVGIADPENFALSSLELSSDTITRRGGLQILTEITRAGPAAQRTVRMNLEKRELLADGTPDLSLPQIRDGQTLVPERSWERSETVDLRENGSALVEFQFDETLPLGTHHGSVELVGDDALPVDNIRYFTVDVREPWRVLIVHPAGVYPDNLQFTLAPRQNVAPEESLFAVDTILQSDIDRPNLNRYQAIFLLDPEPMPDTTWGALKRYVETGGGLGIFLGHNAAAGAEADPSFRADNAAELLTGQLDFPWRRPDGNLFLSPDNLAHPIYDAFRGRETSVPWSNHPVYYYWGLEPDQNPESHPTQTLLRFGNARPAIIERQIGSGRVLTMLTPITEPARPEGRSRWNDLFLDEPPPWPMFLLLRQICDYLVQSGTDTYNIEVGQPARLRNPRQQFPTEYRMFSPRDESTTTPVNVPDNLLRYRFTERPGQYRLRGLADPPVVRGFSVNLPPQATDLTRVDSEQLDLILGSEQYQLGVDRSEIQRQQGTSRSGREFYPILIVMACLLLGVENLMSDRFYGSRSSS